MNAIIILIGLVWGVLNLILFFKIWGMCNDVNRLTNHFCSQPTSSAPVSAHEEQKTVSTPSGVEVAKYDKRLDSVKVGDRVRRLSDGKVLEVTAVGEKVLECKGGMLDGIHTYPKDALWVV